MQKNYGRAGVILLVILAYAYFLSFHFSLTDFTKIPKDYYAYLTEGFLHGKLSLSITPSPELLKSPNPFLAQNEKYWLTDVSLFQGKYYLYFGLLPVISFIMPFKLLTGVYPSEIVGIFFFVVIGFLANFQLLIRIKEDYFPTLSEMQLLFSGLVVGFATNSLFLLRANSSFGVPTFYELAIASAFCFVSLAICFLYAVLNRPVTSRNVFLFSLCLSLAVAGRPHFLIIVMMFALMIAVYLWKYTSKKTFVSALAALILPILFMVIMLCLYNYLRFGSILEFGFHYQLKKLDPSAAELRFMPYRLYLYFLRPAPSILGYPVPFIYTMPLYKVHYLYQFTMGVLLLSPVILALLYLPKIAYLYYKNPQLSTDKLCRFMLFIAFIPVTIIAYLSVLSFSAQRYESDFLPCLVILAIVSWWFFADRNKFKKSFLSWSAFFITLGMLSIMLSINLILPHALHVYKYDKSVSVLFDGWNFFAYFYVKQHLWIVNILPLLFILVYYGVKINLSRRFFPDLYGILDSFRMSIKRIWT
jgi:hypothetical protein